MPTNEDGEFELILGNKQLLSVFFIVVVLLGVFFSMGYFVGRSSNPVGAMETASAKTDAPASSRPPIVVEPDQPQAGMTATAAKPDAAADSTTPAPPPTVEVTKVTPSTPEPAKPADPKPAETEKAKPFPAAPEPTVAAAAASGDPLPGQSYLQVGAVKKAEADALLEVLRKRGFSATTAPVPGQALYRVLVGPIKDGTHLAETRNNLESVGFKNAIKRSY